MGFFPILAIQPLDVAGEGRSLVQFQGHALAQRFIYFEQFLHDRFQAPAVHNDMMIAPNQLIAMMLHALILTLTRRLIRVQIDLLIRTQH
ncbi:hypothetical protein D3C77_210890 [compost metagenome]